MFPSYQTDEIPIWGFFKSSSDRPTPYKTACDAPCDLGSVILELNLFSLEDNDGDDDCGGGVMVSVVDDGPAAAVMVVVVVVGRSESL